MKAIAAINVALSWGVLASVWSPLTSLGRQRGGVSRRMAEVAEAG